MIAQGLPSGGLTMAALGLVGICPNRLLSGYSERGPTYLTAPISDELTQVSVQRGESVEAGRPPSLSGSANQAVALDRAGADGSAQTPQ